MAKHWADVQYEVHLNGMKGAVPRLPTDLTRLEELTERRQRPGPVGYVAGGRGGAGKGRTMRANRVALTRRSIVTRMLRDVSERDLLHPDDARLAVDTGMDGVPVVSHHGGPAGGRVRGGGGRAAGRPRGGG